MNFDWVKVPKNKQEEKEQFDKLYQMLVRMSAPAASPPPPPPPAPVVAPSPAPAPPLTPAPLDEFTRMKLDLLANLRMSGGVSIQPLETCRGCDRSFYSKEELNKHYTLAPACQEWVRRGLLRSPFTEIPFFSLLDEGLRAFMGSQGRSCRFCEKPIANQRALERHFQTSAICNRLAHDTFRTWYGSLPSAPPAQPVFALPALPAPSSDVQRE